MILRKPYAFLIKHFRMIHCVMLICMSYILWKTWNILDFFNGYIASSQVLNTIENISASYISALLLIVVGFVIVESAIVLYLMKHKKKPWIYYIFMLISYALLFVLLLFTSSFLYDIQFSVPDLRITKLIRDIYLAIFIVQIPCVIITLVRAVGFDIKRFDFRKDLLDLDISEEDNAEFELELGLDTEDIRAKARKKIRYFKYYYKENKIIFIGALFLIAMVSLALVVSYTFSKEKVYREMESFTTRSLEIKVLDSYKTELDYKGNIISDQYYYIILKVRYKNISATDLQINLDNARLSYTEYNNVAPTKMVYNKFVEFGTPYYSQILHSGEQRDFVLVYEIDKKYIDAEIRLKYLYNIETVNNQAQYQYKTVNLKPKTFSDKKQMDAKKLNEELIFTDSLLQNTKIRIDNIDLNSNYTYNTIRCKNEVCNKYVNFLIPTTGGTYDLTLMRIKYQLSYDPQLGEDYSIRSFISKFGSIRFVIDGKEYEHKVEMKDVTPYPTEGYVYLEVREKLNKAEKIYLDFTIRDKVYTYMIKDTLENQEEKPTE